MMRRVMICASFLILAGWSVAGITIGPYTFDDDSFPDVATYVDGGPASYNFTPSGDTAADLLTAVDSDVDTYMYGTSVRFQLEFVNNQIINDTGADLVIFELGEADAVEVIVFIDGVPTAARNYMITPTGYFTTSGYSLNAVAIDLDDFGVSAMDTVQKIELFNTNEGGTTYSSSICAVSVLNSIAPEPATLLLIALGGLIVRRRR